MRGSCLCGGVVFEIARAAGLRDGDPPIAPDRHVFVEHRPAWTPGGDDLPGLTRAELVALRKAARR